MVLIRLAHTFAQIPDLHLHTAWPFLCHYPMWWRNVYCLPKSDCIAMQLTKSRAWLYNSQHAIKGRNWYATSVLQRSDHLKFNLMWHYLFCILYFVL
jgi:hypothetical protein